MGRQAPLAPDAFEAMLREGMERESAEAGTGFRFTNGKDATAVCIPQYREGFLRLMAAGGHLNFSMCSWGDAQVQVLAAALVYAQAHEATSQAEYLYLNINQLTDASVPPLVEAMAALPKLKKLWVMNNAIGEEAKEALDRDIEQKARVKEAARLAALGVTTQTADQNSMPLVHRPTAGYVRDIDLGNFATAWLKRELLTVSHTWADGSVVVQALDTSQSDIHASVKEKRGKRHAAGGSERRTFCARPRYSSSRRAPGGEALEMDARAGGRGESERRMISATLGHSRPL